MLLHRACYNHNAYSQDNQNIQDCIDRNVDPWSLHDIYNVLYKDHKIDLLSPNYHNHIAKQKKKTIL